MHFIPRERLLDEPKPVAPFEAVPQDQGRIRGARTPARRLPHRELGVLKEPPRAPSLLEAFLRHLNAPSGMAPEGANTRSLVRELSDVIRARASRAILRRSEAPMGRNELQDDVEELTQEVLLVLFAERARALRAWDPARGLSLRNYVGMVATREITRILESGRRSPWNERRVNREPTEAETGSSPGAESQILAGNMIAYIMTRLRQEASPLAVQLFKVLFVDDRSIEEARAATGMTRDSIYAWRSRLSKMACRIADSMAEET